ncbi:MAG: hypothetical protein R3C01_06000 [Planctomycetaceae bacterium]
MSIENEIQKLKYHVKLLAESLPLDTDSYASLAIERDWDSADISRAHDIFEKYDKAMAASGSLDGSGLEHELRDTFGIGYQEVKGIVCTFWNSGQWRSVCRSYADQHQCAEFHGILGRE